MVCAAAGHAREPLTHSLPPGSELLPPVPGLKTAFHQKAHVHAVPEVVPD